MALVIHVLNVPEILLDGRPALLPYRKAEALLYYLTVEKRTSREEAADLLWGDNDPETAKKNLRHALYVIKKALGDAVLTGAHGVLSLNEARCAPTDADALSAGASAPHGGGTLLKGFSVKNAPSFDEWLERRRENLRSVYLSRLYQHIEALPDADLPALELSCADYLLEDAYDERVAVRLMRAYAGARLYSKGIGVYQKLRETLNSELGVDPAAETTQLYRDILDRWNENNAADGDLAVDDALVYGRGVELSQLDACLRETDAKGSRGVLIGGEPGVGKSFLLRAFLDRARRDGATVACVQCFSSGQNYPLQILSPLMTELSEASALPLAGPAREILDRFTPATGGALDFSAGYGAAAAETLLPRLFSELAARGRVVLAVEDLQWADEQSLRLLSTLIQTVPAHLLVVFTCLCPPAPAVQVFAGELSARRRLTELALGCFSLQDAQALAAQRLGPGPEADRLGRQAYERTGGNAFFLMEALNSYAQTGDGSVFSLGAQNILAARLSALSREGRHMLDALAVFEAGAPLPVLRTMFHLDEFVLLDTLSELKVRALVAEELRDGQVVFRFLRERMREFLYSQLSPSKLCLLHARAAAAMEQCGAAPRQRLYPRIQRHYAAAGEPVKAFRYELMILDDSSGASFELFPSRDAQAENGLLTDAHLLSRFSKLENRLRELLPQVRDGEERDDLFFHLYSAKARCCIMTGLYPEGLSAAGRVLSQPGLAAHPERKLVCLRQMIYYGIQLFLPEVMLKNIEEGFALARASGLAAEEAILWRLDGLARLMLGDYDRAVHSLDASLNALRDLPELPEPVCRVNLAAAHNYLGEVRRCQDRPEEALALYQRSVDLCEQAGTPGYAVVACSNMATAKLMLGELPEAERAFTRSAALYDGSYTLMGRGVTRSWCAFFAARRGDFSGAAAALGEAVSSCNRLGSPLEKSILRLVENALLERWPATFSAHLPGDRALYQADLETQERWYGRHPAYRLPYEAMKDVLRSAI